MDKSRTKVILANVGIVLLILIAASPLVLVAWAYGGRVVRWIAGLHHTDAFLGGISVGLVTIVVIVTHSLRKVARELFRLMERTDLRIRWLDRRITDLEDGGEAERRG